MVCEHDNKSRDKKVFVLLCTDVLVVKTVKKNRMLGCGVGPLIMGEDICNRLCDIRLKKKIDIENEINCSPVYPIVTVSYKLLLLPLCWLEVLRQIQFQLV